MKAIFLWVLLLSFSPGLGEAQPSKPLPSAVVLSENVYQGNLLGSYFEYFMDPTGDVTFKEILAGKYNEHFIRSKRDSLGFGFNANPVWLRCAINNPRPDLEDFYLEIGYSHLDQIALYVPDENGDYAVREAGDKKPYHEREFDHHNFIFNISQAPGTKTYYVRIQTTSSLSIPISIYNENSLKKKLITEYLLYGMFYGTILVMILYNLFVFISTRDPCYFAYVIFLIACLLTTLSLNGLGYKLVWPNSPLLAGSVPFFLPVANAGGLVFSMVYLDTRKKVPILHKTCLGMIVVYVAMIVSAYLIPYEIAIRIAVSLQTVGMILVLIIGAYYLKLKERAVYFFFPSWIFLIAGTAISQSKAAGLLSSNTLTNMGIEVGAVIQVILFSLGMADKLNFLKNSLQDMNLNLETMVSQRTQALKQSNKELLETRDALWGEMMLAKKIQIALLPPKPHINGYEIVGYMKPADEVGGDYYDVINCDGHDWFVIGDVSGHGVSSGLIMMMVQTAIRVALRDNPEASPSRILESVNSIITENIRKLGEDKYMTITVFAVQERGTLKFSGLHQDLLIYRAETQMVEEVETEGVWLGVMENVEGVLRNDSALLNKNDVMMLYTDGIVEAMDENNNLYSNQRLISVYKEAASGSTESIKDAIIASLQGYSCADDTTMLIVKKT